MTSRSGQGTRAATYMIAATLFLSMVPVFVKAIPESSGIPLSQKLFARAFVSGLITLSVLLARRISIRPGSPILLGIRSLLGICGMLTYFTAVERLPLAEAVTINRLSPFFVLLFAALFLGERLKRPQVLAVFLGFAGVAVILRPGSVHFSGPGLLALLSAVFAGGAYTALRGLRKTDRPLVIVFWFSLVMTLAFLPGLLRDGVIPDWRSLLCLLGIGLAGAAGQLLMTKAYRCAPGGQVAIYGYLSVLFSMVWQTVFFSSVPEAAVFAGAGLILLGGWLNYRGR